MAQTATQEFVPLKEVRDGIVILKDGSMRAIIMASSLNFALKSEDERTAILLQFQNFLNSLDFSVQISIQSRRLDIRPYLALLEEREKEQLTDLMKIQTQEYIEFVRKFTDDTNIMTKTFFVVIPYSPAMLQGKENVKSRFNIFKKNKSSTAEKNLANTAVFEENRSQLEQRIEVVEQGLLRSGIRVARLGTEELTEIFYKIFNPGETASSVKTS